MKISESRVTCKNIASGLAQTLADDTNIELFEDEVKLQQLLGQIMTLHQLVALLRVNLLANRAWSRLTNVEGTLGLLDDAMKDLSNSQIKEHALEDIPHLLEQINGFKARNPALPTLGGTR